MNLLLGSIIFILTALTGILLVMVKQLKKRKKENNELIHIMDLILGVFNTVLTEIKKEESIGKLQNLKKDIRSGKSFDPNLFDLLIKQILDQRNSSNESSSIGVQKIDPRSNQEIQEFVFYKETLSQLLISIMNHLSSTTVPISQELGGISENIVNFEKNMKNYEEEIKEKKFIHQLMNRNEQLSSEIKQLSNYMDQLNKTLQVRMTELNNIISKIHDKSKQIQDISEKVNVLSINTSIEASRAGVNGKGFKVIAFEIKKLSEYSQNFVKEIKNTIVDSKKLVDHISKELIGSHSLIHEKIDNQKNHFTEFYQQLFSFFDQFESMYNNINVFRDHIVKSTDKISPVVQLHEITIQEMENLKLALTDFFSEKIQKILEEIQVKSVHPEMELAKEKAFIVRKRLTTSRELNALSAALNAFNFQDKIDLKRDEKQIEFF